MSHQTAQYIAVVLVALSIWVMLFALRVVGIKPESWTQRIIRAFRIDPFGASLLTLFVLGAMAYGGSKGPIIRPPIVVHQIPVYIDPVAGILRPVWSRYHQELREQAPIVPPPQPEPEETP